MDESIVSNCDTNILDLNEDCLREILEYLGLSDLCAVASACDRLREITQAHFATSVFTEILVWNFSDTCSMVNEKYRVNTEEFLQNFGPFIKSVTVMGIHYYLEINRLSQPKIDHRDQNRILELLSYYCSETLQELVLWNYFVTDDTALLLKPLLLSLHRLRIEKFSLGDLFLRMLPKWAPELRELEYECIDDKVVSGEAQFVGLQAHFHKLERISLKRVSGVRKDTVEELLKQNPQLKNIEVDCDGVHVEMIVKHAPHIESIRICSGMEWIEWEKRI